MELRDFVQNVLTDIDAAVDGARREMKRDVHLSETKDQRTVEFDVAVSVETTDEATGKAGIKVLQFVEGGGTLSQETRNSTVSRIKFGVHINPRTKEEQHLIDAQWRDRTGRDIADHR